MSRSAGDVTPRAGAGSARPARIAIQVRIRADQY